MLFSIHSLHMLGLGQRIRSELWNTQRHNKLCLTAISGRANDGHVQARMYTLYMGQTAVGRHVYQYASINAFFTSSSCNFRMCLGSCSCLEHLQLVCSLERNAESYYKHATAILCLWSSCSCYKQSHTTATTVSRSSCCVYKQA